MPRIRVEKVLVENFKKIKNHQISLKPITAIVGGNASGKSSILQAAQLCTSLLQAGFVSEKVTRKGRKIDRLSTLANEDVFYRPTEKLLNLRHGEPASQTKSFKLGYECISTDDDGIEKTIKLSVAVTRGKNANLALSYEGDECLIPVLGNRDRPFSIFTPGLSGIPLREEWRTRGALDAAAMHGDANLYLRTLLDHLLRKDMSPEDAAKWCNKEIDIKDLPQGTPWCTFSTYLDECYPGARVYIHHDNNKDRFVEVKVKYIDKFFTLDIASTGMLQVIQILAYACFYSPPLLLLDEPDAHLHADSQARLHQALQALAKGGSTKIVLATHSPQLLQLLLNDNDASVVWLSSGAEVTVPPGQRPAIPLLMELGALTVGAEAFTPQNQIILLTEDKDTFFVKSFAAANTASSFACLSYNGCSNLAGARQLAILLSELRPDAKIIIHRDRDFRTDEEMAFERLLFKAWLAAEGGMHIEEIFTPSNDIEHSFLNIEHLAEALGRVATRAQIEDSLAEAVALKRDDLIEKVRLARGVIERSLYDSDRMKKKTGLRAESRIQLTAPKVKTFLPKDGVTPIELRQCHGKTAFRAFLTSLHKRVNGDSKALPSLIRVKTEHLRSETWESALKPIEALEEAK